MIRSSRIHKLWKYPSSLTILFTYSHLEQRFWILMCFWYDCQSSKSFLSFSLGRESKNYEWMQKQSSKPIWKWIFIIFSIHFFFHLLGSEKCVSTQKSSAHFEWMILNIFCQKKKRDEEEFLQEQCKTCHFSVFKMAPNSRDVSAMLPNFCLPGFHMPWHHRNAQTCVFIFWIANQPPLVYAAPLFFTSLSFGWIRPTFTEF